jgi:FixJ family two-component response regulator
MEQEILREIVAGSSLKQVALKLDLQLAQVETQRASLMRKLNATTTADLVRVGIYAEL